MREDEAGSYPGDGPTTHQLDLLTVGLRPLSETPESVTVAELWAAFKICTDTETAWLFPERDPLGEPMSKALKQIQEVTGTLLEKNAPHMATGLHRYADLAEAGRLAYRAAKLKGNGFQWRLVVARFLYSLSMNKRP